MTAPSPSGSSPAPRPEAPSRQPPPPPPRTSPSCRSRPATSPCARCPASLRTRRPENRFTRRACPSPLTHPRPRHAPRAGLLGPRGALPTLRLPPRVHRRRRAALLLGLHRPRRAHHAVEGGEQLRLRPPLVRRAAVRRGGIRRGEVHHPPGQPAQPRAGVRRAPGPRGGPPAPPCRACRPLLQRTSPLSSRLRGPHRNADCSRPVAGARRQVGAQGHPRLRLEHLLGPSRRGAVGGAPQGPGPSPSLHGSPCQCGESLLLPRACCGQAPRRPPAELTGAPRLTALRCAQLDLLQLRDNGLLCYGGLGGVVYVRRSAPPASLPASLHPGWSRSCLSLALVPGAARSPSASRLPRFCCPLRRGSSRTSSTRTSRRRRARSQLAPGGPRADGGDRCTPADALRCVRCLSQAVTDPLVPPPARLQECHILGQATFDRDLGVLSFQVQQPRMVQRAEERQDRNLKPVRPRLPPGSCSSACTVLLRAPARPREGPTAARTRPRPQPPPPPFVSVGRPRRGGGVARRADCHALQVRRPASHRGRSIACGGKGEGLVPHARL